MEIGLLEWFDETKGFGVIKTSDNQEIFLHIKNWGDKQKPTMRNQYPVLFEITTQKNKKTAIECTYFDPLNEKHWFKLICLNELTYVIIVNSLQRNIIELALDKVGNDFPFSIFNPILSEHLRKLTVERLFNKKEIHYILYKRVMDIEFSRCFIENITLRIHHLDDQQIINFWKQNIIEEFTPEDHVLTRNYNQIQLSDLEKINNHETQYLIILKKVYDLRKDFNPIIFSEFGAILNLIDDVDLRAKISADLNDIAIPGYIEYLKDRISELTKKQNLKYSEIKEFLIKQPTFLNNDFLEKVSSYLINEVLKECSFKTIIECWENGLIEQLETSYIHQSVKNQNISDLLYLLHSKKTDELIADSILFRLYSDKVYETLLDEAKKISQELFDKYCKLVLDSVDGELYLNLWEKKKTKIIPLDFLSIYLNHLEKRYSELKKWVYQALLSKQEATDLLFSIIKKNDSVDDRYKFYQIFYSVKCIIEIDSNNLELLQTIENKIISLVLWHLKKKENIDFNFLKGKFIFFKPDDQVYIFKRLFYLKYEGIIDFDLKELDEILRADIDLHLANEKFNDDFTLDISTHVIIECLKSYSSAKTFTFESDLILQDLKKNSKRKFKLDKYFDLCEGRMTPYYNWNAAGKVSQVYFAGDKFYYAISFEPGKDVISQTYYGQTTYFQKNPDFDRLKEEVKKLPARKWNSVLNHWGVPSNYKDEVYEFAKKNNFFLDLADRKHYVNNVHLAYFTRNIKEGNQANAEKKNIPQGVTFCEGRKANKQNEKFGKEFWWCCNQECFQNSVDTHFTIESIDDVDSWEKYTLYDFVKILELNVDEFNGIDHIKDGHYFKFLGHINAFNRLIERLYCNECNNLLYPAKTSHFALYTDTRFHCIEDTCSLKGKEVYLNNCLYGECKTIIDSRVSKRCEYGLYICPNCGTCCSEDYFKKRLETLQNVGGYIHPDLILNVQRKNGHLEKKEYYCYKCANMMTETSIDTYRCSRCQITYNLDKYKWLQRKWTQTAMRRKDYPIQRQDQGMEN